METSKVLDTNVLIDGDSGLTTILNIIEYPKAIEKGDSEVIFPTRSDYITAVEIMVDLFEFGKAIPAIDVLIAAICLNRKLTLVTRDGHFRYVKSVRKELSLQIRNTPKQE